jgi:Family of unknown function (DUF6011)
MSTPTGLARFQRSITSKRDGTCHFCGAATKAGTDFAVLDNGKWIAVCVPHAYSLTEQAKAVLLTIQAEAQAFNLDADALAAVNAHAPANVADVLAGQVDEYGTAAAITKLIDALAVVRTFKPADPTVGKLQALLAGTTATAWERDFAASIVAQLGSGRTLSDKQAAVVQRVLAGSQPTDNGPDTCTPEHGGIYDVNGTLYLVKQSKGGNLYAMVLASAPQPGRKLDWQYSAGSVKVVRRSGRPITAAEAAALGHTTSFCCFCSLELTDDRSTDVGYGPVCASKRGLPWG